MGSINEVDLGEYATKEMPVGIDKWGKYEFSLVGQVSPTER